MKLLAIETATEACSAALLIDGNVIDRHEVAPRQHNQLILPMCEHLLAEGGVSAGSLDAIAFGCGPGAFTGVRIAASVTQGIAIAHDLPVIPVSTLENLAYQANTKVDEYVMPAIDARMDEIYWAVYKRISSNQLELIVAEQVQEPEHVNFPDIEISMGLGSGWGSYESILMGKTHLSSDRVIGDALPSARVVAELALTKFLDNNVATVENALPVYLRNNVVHNKK